MIEESSPQAGHNLSRYQKGIRLIFLERAVDFVATLLSELGDVSMDPWKSYLFFLTSYCLEIGLSRAKAIC